MIVVTGAAGFIGSALIAGLNKKGIEDILAVDELGCDDKWKNLRGLKFIEYAEKQDFLDMVLQGRLLSPIQTIFHLGACSSTTETDCSYLVKNNYEYSKTLAQWAINNSARFIYASSAATYGDGEQGFVDHEERIETLKPLNMYGYSKQMFDLWVKRSDLLDKIVGVKYFNVFGPNEYHKQSMKSFILKSFEQIKETGKVKLFKSYHEDYANGEHVRDFIYVKDAVDMTLFFYENKNIKGLFNIGTGRARSWNDLINAVFAAMNKTPEIEYINMPASIRGQYQYFTQADVSKIRKAGYTKKTFELEGAVKDYVQNYLQKGEYLTGI